MNPKDKKQSEQLSLLKAHKAELVSMQKETTKDTLEAIENKLLEDSIAIISDCMSFADMGFDESGNPITPESWEWLSTDDKEKRMRLAKATWMTSADVPYGIKMAHATAMGIIKSRATKESGNKTLNIETAVFPAPQSLTKTEEEDVLEIDE